MYVRRLKNFHFHVITNYLQRYIVIKIISYAYRARAQELFLEIYFSWLQNVAIVL